MRNILHVEADIKGQRRIPAYTVTQNDSVSIVVSVLDGGSPVNLDEVSTMTIACTRRDGLVVVKDGTQTGPYEVTFDLGTSEIEQTGKVDAVIQLYSADGRVSTIKFSFMVTKDPTGDGYVPSEEERTLIEVVLGDGPLVIERAEMAAASAEGATAYIDEKKPLIDKFTDEQTSLQAQLDEVARGATNVETSQARVSTTGTAYGTLKQRLDTEYEEVTTQLAQTETEIKKRPTKENVDIELYKKRDKSTPIGLDDADANLLSAIQGGTSFNLLSIPRDFSVTPEKTTFLNINKSTNVFNKDSQENVIGHRVVSGELSEDSVSFTSHPIFCKNGDKINVLLIGTDYYGGYLFGEDGTPLSRVQASDGVITISHTDASYIKLNGYINNMDSIMVTVNKPLPTEYQSYHYKVTIPDDYLKIENITANMTDFIRMSKNKIDESKSVVGILSGVSGLVLNSDLTSYKSTEYIFIPKGTNFVVSPQVRRLYLYPDDKGTQSFYMLDELTNNFSHTTQQDCYVRLSYLASDSGRMMLEFVNDGVSSPSNYEPYGYFFDNLNIPKDDLVHTINGISPDENGDIFFPKSHLHNQTVVCFGDSITAMNYTQPIREITGATVIKQGYTGTRMNPTPNVNESNRAFSFLRLVESIVNNDFALQDSLVSQSSFAGEWDAELSVLKTINFNNVNIITIAYGTNDWDSATVLKNEADSFDETTYYGGARKAIKTLLTKYPHLKILFITPIPRAEVSTDGNTMNYYGDTLIKSSTGYNVGTYADCLKDVGKSLGIPVVDNYYTLGMTEWNQPYYFGSETKKYGDGVHPNAIGRSLIGTRIANELLRHY